MENQNLKEESVFKTWLDKLQQESWQLELLISGFAIFGLFQLSDFLEHSFVLANANFHYKVERINLMVLSSMFYGITNAVVKIFILNLLVHVFVRGLWIGAIGLRYISGEIEYDQLRYNSRFIDFYKRTVGSFDEYIVKLEKIASVIFSFTFLLAFLFLSYFIFSVEMFSVFKFIHDVFGVSEPTIQLLSNITLGFISIIAFDFVTLGLLKKIKQRHLSKFYYVLYRIVGALTLSFIWRPLLLNFLDDKITKRILWLIVPYLALTIFVLPKTTNSEFVYFPSYFSTSGDYSIMFWKNFYDSTERDDYYNIRVVSIPSEEVQGNVFKTFVKFDIIMDEVIELLDSTLHKPSTIGFSNPFSNRQASLYTPKEQKKIVQEKLDALKKMNSTIDEPDLKDSLKIVVSRDSRAMFQQKIKDVLNLLESTLVFKIDGEPIDKEKLGIRFYIHPNAKEKGLLCYFPIDLEIGTHEFTYGKLQKSKFKNQKLDTINFSIPFVYVGK